MESILSLPVEEGAPSVLDTILNDLRVSSNDTPAGRKMDGGKLILYSTVMACLILMLCLLKDKLHMSLLFLLTALAFAGILSTLELP